MINLAYIYYRIRTFIGAMIAILTMDQKTIDSFFSSYQLFEKTKVSGDDKHKIINYYQVLNYLCALGNVEKMYIPPILDRTKGIIENQNLFEKKMMQDIKIKKNYQVLDIGCGRGRIACHVADSTGAFVQGINIDNTQIDSAKAYAKAVNLDNKTNFIPLNYNNPLPFSDEYFDAVYQVQAFTYAEDVDKLFAEIYRVMKPGARFSWIDWVILDDYSQYNEVHQKALAGTKAVIGGVLTQLPSFWFHVMRKAGFNIIKNEIPSIDQVQYPLIESEARYFTIFGKIISFLVKIRLVPKHLELLFDRLNKHGDDFIFADKNRLCTTTYHIILEKPASYSLIN